jgi:hypothetical protein
MPLANEITKGILSKTAKAALKGFESSASKALKGTPFKNGIISKITKGKGDWRYLFLEGVDEPELVNKSVVNSLARSAGTAKYAAKFAAAPQESKLAQAYKSLEMHKGKANVDKKLILDFHDNYTKQLKLSGAPVPKMSLVLSEGKHLTLPTDYAKTLELEGAVKVLKDLK